MDYEIRKVRENEYDAALALIGQTFLECIAPDYGPQGTAAFFRDVIDSEAFRQDFARGRVRMWGCFAQGTIISAFALRGENHLCLAFTRKGEQNMGIGRRVFCAVLSDLKRSGMAHGVLTVHASPSGTAFYRSLGFVAVDGEKTEDGIRYLPMRCEF